MTAYNFATARDKFNPFKRAIYIASGRTPALSPGARYGCFTHSLERPKNGPASGLRGLDLSGRWPGEPHPDSISKTINGRKYMFQAEDTASSCMQVTIPGDHLSYLNIDILPFSASMQQ